MRFAPCAQDGDFRSRRGIYLHSDGIICHFRTGCFDGSDSNFLPPSEATLLSWGTLMTIRKLLAIACTAMAFFWAPSVIPTKFSSEPVRVAALAGCGVIITWQTADTAFALPPAPVPCPTSSMATPWVGIGIAAGALSVIVNGAIIGKTQCRELTSKEAITSILLPFIGILFNEQHSLCGRKK